MNITIANYTVGPDKPLLLIAGPCVIESAELCREVAGAMREICAERGINYVFKASFDKANRTSASSARGIGLQAALEIFSEVKERLGLPVTTDVHGPEQCGPVGKVVDILQIPAFLCRQTDLLVAAAETGRVVNVKKGQFLAPWDMRNVAAKVRSAGNPVPTSAAVTTRSSSRRSMTLSCSVRMAGSAASRSMSRRSLRME